MDDEIKAEIDALKQEQIGAMGELAVLVCAVESLIRTHPDPAAFSSAFRRAWLRVGAPNQALEADDEAGDRMRSVLEVLEAACRVPLGVRPPGVAADPED